MFFAAKALLLFYCALGDNLMRHFQRVARTMVRHY